MPGADISQVQVTFGNSIKREEYGPVKKAEVSIIAIVNTGEDGVIALNYITKIAQDKVREMLTIQGQPAAAAAEPSSTPGVADKGSPDIAGEGEQPEKRTRRTKAEMEAARAAEASTGSAAAEPAATAASETQAVDTTSTTSAASAGEANEWDVGGAEAVATITDQVLNHTCGVTAERIRNPLAVSVVIKLFRPGGDRFDPSSHRRPVFVGHNLVGFDLRFLFQRSVMLGIRPPIWMPVNPKPWDESVFDTMTAWSGFGNRVSLDKLCRAFGIAAKGSEIGEEIDGSMVWNFVQAGRIADVAKYCAGDIERTREIHKRLTFQSFPALKAAA